MDLTTYVVYSFFTISLYLLSHVDFARHQRILLLISGALLIGLGVSSLQLTISGFTSTSYSSKTFTGEFWQTLLFWVYAIIGLANIIMGVMEINRTEDWYIPGKH